MTASPCAGVAGRVRRTHSAALHRGRTDSVPSTVTNDRPVDPYLDPDVDPDDPSWAGLRWPAIPLSQVAVVFAGGVLGGLARYGISQAWPASTASFPTAILVINTAGAFVLGVLVTAVALRAAPKHLRPFLGTGFCGAFTTFSSVVTADDLLLAHGHAGIAVGYLAASLAAGLAAVFAAMALTRRVLGERS
jgi:CrcB protein